MASAASLAALILASCVAVVISIPEAEALNGSLYVSSDSTNEVKRYDASTGNFVDTFISAGSTGLVSPVYLTFGPDGNLYVISEFSKDVERYNGSTGTFINTFVAAGSGGLVNPSDLTFGPDGNLYVSDVLNGIKRYNGSTGAFMDIFVPSGAGGLTNPFELAFGPDANLYVIDGTHGVKRFNGTTGAFIDTLVPAIHIGPSGASGLAFSVASAPPETQKHTLTVNAVDLSGKPINGIWTTIRLLNGTLAKAGFAPLTFAGDNGTSYKVAVANYDGKIFQSWDDKSTNNIRTVNLSNDITITTTYDTGDSLRGFTSLTYTGTDAQPDLKVNALAVGTNKTLHMWTVIDPQSTDASGTTYKVYAGNYQNIVFDRWNDGNTERIRTLTIGEATTLTAYYRMSMD